MDFFYLVFAKRILAQRNQMSSCDTLANGEEERNFSISKRQVLCFWRVCDFQPGKGLDRCEAFSQLPKECHVMGVRGWRNGFEMSSGNNFHLNAMSPSPMPISTRSCDPSAQPLGLNGLHKSTKTRKQTLADIWVPRQFGKHIRKPQWSGCLDSHYPKSHFPSTLK